MLGVTCNDRRFDIEGGNLDVTSKVSAVCDFYGPTNFLKMDEAGSDLDHSAAKSPESRLVGGPIEMHRSECMAANPIIYVTGDEPPFLIMHGDDDRLVPWDQSRLLHEALRNAGADSTFEKIEGGAHGLRNSPVEETVKAFFDRHLM